MIRYIDIDTQEILRRDEVKRRLSVRTITVPVSRPVPPIIDDEGNSIPQPDIIEHEQRQQVRSINRLGGVSAADLLEKGIARIELTETPKPDIELWQTVEKGPVDKSENGEWVETWIVNDMEFDALIIKVKDVLTRRVQKRIAVKEQQYLDENGIVAYWQAKTSGTITYGGVFDRFGDMEAAINEATTVADIAAIFSDE